MNLDLILSRINQTRNSNCGTYSSYGGRKT